MRGYSLLIFGAMVVSGSIDSVRYYALFYGVDAGGISSKNTSVILEDTDHVMALSRYGYDSSTFRISVRACHDAVIYLSSSHFKSRSSYVPFYEVVFGAFSTTKLYLLRRRDASLSQDSFTEPFGEDGIDIDAYYHLHCDQYKPYWFVVENGKIQIGYGYILGKNKFASWEDPEPFVIRSYYLSSRVSPLPIWAILFDDEFTGYFRAEFTPNQKANLKILESFYAVRSICCAKCASLYDCSGFNYNHNTEWCEILTFDSWQIPHTSAYAVDEEGTKYYTKCFKDNKMCIAHIW